jgi:hypothetical protein
LGDAENPLQFALAFVVKDKPVAPNLYQIHLYDWLETNAYGRFLVDNDL